MSRVFCVLVGVSFCFVGVFFLDSVCRVLFFWRCVMFKIFWLPKIPDSDQDFTFGFEMFFDLI